MPENPLGIERAAEYYTAQVVSEKYTQNATEGLTSKERKAISQYFSGDEAKVLDLGCGTGRTTVVLDEMGFDVVGVDLLKSQLSTARNLFPDIELSVGDAMSLPFSAESFDYVLFSFNGIDEIYPEEKRYETLLEIWRVLKSGGIFLFSSHNLLTWLVVHPFHPRSILETLYFWRLNADPRRLLSKYKIDHTVTNGPVPVYYSRPVTQRRQLEASGFEFIETVTPDKSVRRRFDPWHYYVARKPHGGDTV